MGLRWEIQPYIFRIIVQKKKRSMQVLQGLLLMKICSTQISFVFTYILLTMPLENSRDNKERFCIYFSTALEILFCFLSLSLFLFFSFLIIL
ncbi:hypothetical protein BDF14DRAFT_1813987 [Spinellus fusiger]|nr:hypothetical protein BDF14DRAFT_1813987 [Spinellus fusiger]